MLADRMKAAQQGDQQALLDLMEQFAPLLKKYSRRLREEDGYSDLVLEFITLIKQVDLHKFRIQSDAAMVSYISRSIYHAYIKLSQAQKKIVANEVPMEPCFVGISENQSDDFSNLIAAAPLTKAERDTLILIYLYGYTAAELARRQQVTRQSVTKRKRNALKKMKKFLESII